MKEGKKPNKVKAKEVEILNGLLKKYKTVGLLDLTNLPSPQLQKMRKKLNGEIRVTKKRLLRISLKEIDKGLENLDKELDKIMPGLILTNDSSFKLSKFLRQSKSLVNAKPGQIAPRDIIVNAGATSLPPGPIIGELGGAGIKASVEGGKVTIKQDCVVVKEGQVINEKAASILSKLGIKPIEIGLNLVATFENGSLLRKEVLDIDDSIYINKLKEIVSNALSLTVGIGYATKDNINLLIRKAVGEAKAIDSKVNIERDKLKNEFSQAQREAESLSENMNDSGGN